ncbi:ATP-binding protein [Nocardia sp. NPDC127526]|uniref:sensor histidine kinase n=1 Tax=Nocardia sp. NPDC127526 TaxID=3345393 RepID=UPI0036418DF7
MRTQVNDMFETLARRSKSLVDHQLSLIEAMEYDEKDPRLLENLFRLDHLAARMRRNGDNLLILAGTKQRRSKSAPVEIADVLRAAISEVEDYERVKLGATPRGSLTEPAASDLAHLFAELLDNALRASPPETDVKFTFAQAHDQGLLIEVADRGIGMPPAEMAEINRRLETTAEVGPDTARHMGLFVVGRLAERHGLTVRLRPTFDTARDPGVTVTVHVPKPLIVGTGGPISVPPQPNAQQPAPQGPAPQGAQGGAGSSMQMRAVTRTATGNVMVTVDPGGSGPIPAGSAPAAPAAPAPAAASAATGLPQRQPGAAAPSVGLPTRQPGTNGPTVKHTVATPGVSRPGGLPQREPGQHGPAGPGAQPGANLPQRAPGEGPAQPRGGLAANMLKRQGGAGGLPPRPGAPGAPGEGLPQRDSGPTQRGPVPPQRDAAASGGLPTRQPGANGAPPREPGLGQPQRSASGGMPPAPGGQALGGGAAQRGGADGGLPQREPGKNGAPQRGGAEAGPNGAAGLPQRGVSESGKHGLPQREAGATGIPQRDSGPTQRGPVPPQRDAAASGGLPQRDSAAGGLPQRGGNGLPPREGGLPSRDGLPQREAGATGIPQRDSAGGGLPRRAPGSNGAPQPGGLPQRGGTDSAAGGQALGGGAAPRDPAAGGLPQRGGNGLPSRDGLPQRESANGQTQRGVAPQREGLPQREGGLPQRDPAAGGLPRRDPGAGLPPRPAPLPGIGLPPSEPSGDPKDRGRHSFRSNPQKAASFFQTRLQPAGESESSMGTPIFAEMMSAWLSDPNADRSQVAASFESPGDEGWQAARRAIESTPERRTAAGLPQRDPGNRLVPGGVNGNADKAPSRDPESIRSSLSRHQQGVRDGRAMKAMNLTGDKGDR